MKKETTIYTRQIAGRIEKERKMAALRAEVLAQSPEKALDAILDAPFPTRLIQSFPDQDLHFLMHHIGEDDFLPVLSRATSEQWEYLLDAEVWHQDRLDPIGMTRMLALLFKADPHRLLRWSITEKPDFLEYFLFRHLEIRVREHDEDPSTFGEGFETIDSVIYFRFPHTLARQSDEIDAEDVNTGRLNGSEKARGMSGNDEQESAVDLKAELIKNAHASELLITEMLGALADMDMSVYQGVMLETSSVLPAETEEEQFRLRTVRLAEKGFLPYHDAVAIYQPLSTSDLTHRPSYYLEHSLYADALPLPPQFAFSSSESKNLFVASLARIDSDVAVNLQAEFAFLVNAVISSEKEPVRSIEDLQKSVDTCCSYLSLGLEKIHAERFSERSARSESAPSDQYGDSFSLEAGAAVIQRYPLKEIFRVGSGVSMILKMRMTEWLSKSWIMMNHLKLTFLDEQWMGVAGGLLLDRPLFFDNYKTGELYRPFGSLAEIDRTSEQVDAILAMDKLLGQIRPDPLYLERPFVTWKALLLTTWVKQRMGLHSQDGVRLTKLKSQVDDSSKWSDLQDNPFIPFSRFKPFFGQLFYQPGLERSSDISGPISAGDNLREKIEGGSEKNGKISDIVRNDFFGWLEEQGAALAEGLTDDAVHGSPSPSSSEKDDDAHGEQIRKIRDSGRCRRRGYGEIIRQLIHALFDELEDEYGVVPENELNADLITHFLFDRER